MRVAIAGSGAIGASVGLALQTLGATTSIFELRSLVAGASGRAFGGIRQQFTDPAEIELAQRSLPFFESLPRALFDPVGYLYLATDDRTESELRSRYQVQRDLGVTCDWLDRESVARTAVGVVTDDVRGALFGPRDGTAEPSEITHHLLRQFLLAGGQIHESSPLPADVLSHFDAVVIATGCETPSILDGLGIARTELANARLPIAALTRSLAETTIVQCHDRLPLVIETHDGFHFRRRGDRIRIAISDAPPRWTTDLDPAPNCDPHWGNEPLERLRRRLPAARTGSIERVWSGLYDVTPDSKPIIDKVSENVYVAAGFSGHGFMISPAVGEGLAKWITCGTRPGLLASFALKRFHTGVRYEYHSPL